MIQYLEQWFTKLALPLEPPLKKCLIWSPKASIALVSASCSFTALYTSVSVFAVHSHSSFIAVSVSVFSSGHHSLSQIQSPRQIGSDWGCQPVCHYRVRYEWKTIPAFSSTTTTPSSRSTTGQLEVCSRRACFKLSQWMKLFGRLSLSELRNDLRSSGEILVSTLPDSW